MTDKPFAAQLTELQEWAKFADIASGPPIHEGSDCRGFGDLGLDLPGDMYKALASKNKRDRLLANHTEAILALVEAATEVDSWYDPPGEALSKLKGALEALNG